MLNTMSDSIIISTVVTIVIGIISFFIKGTLKRIEDNLSEHVRNFNGLNEKVNSINISMVNVTNSLSNIDRDLERANRRVSDINTMVMDSANKLVSYGHDLNILKSQVRVLNKELEEIKSK